MSKRILAVLLSVSLLLMGMPAAVFAVEKTADHTIVVGESITLIGTGAVSADGVVTLTETDGNTVVTGRKEGTTTVTVNGSEKTIAVTAALKSGSGQQAGGTIVSKTNPLTGAGGIVRIPSLMTLNNGNIFIASDIRYDDWYDGGGSDIIVSISEDGEHWNYQFPLYFADSTDNGSPAAATFVDPTCIQGLDGTIYLEANACPTGYLAAKIDPFHRFLVGSGFVTIDGVDRIVLTTTYENACINPATDDGTVYPYYVGDLDANGYAPVLNRADHTPTQWAVDQVYNLYEVMDGEYLQLTQQQYTEEKPNGTIVQQNTFFRDSILHVYNTQYVWVATSKDNGATWSHKIWNVKQGDEYSLQNGCGHGAVAPNGDIFLNFYACFDSKPVEVCFLFSKDDGKTWQRSYNSIPAQHGNYCSDENVIIPLNDGTLRVFFRSDGSTVKTLQYCDAKWDEELQNYVFGDVVVTDVTANNSTKISGLHYSKTIDGAEAIMVSAPSDPNLRAEGKIWTFLVRENNELELAYEWDCPHYNEPTSYGYSDMTELTDGSIAILYEPTYAYENPSIEEVCPGAVIGDAAVSYPPYASAANGAELTKNTVVTLRGDENTTIYYTLDGSEPNTNSAVYTDGLTFINSSRETDTVVLKAMAVTEGKAPSRVLTYTYTVASADSVVADFDTVPYNITDNGSTSSVVDGVLQYKVYSGWSLTVGFDGDPNFVSGDDSALALHVSVPADAPANHSILLIAKESSGAGYGLYPGQTVYLVADGATEAVTATVNASMDNGWTAHSLNLAPGFSGYVVIPATSMQNGSELRKCPFAGSIEDANGQLDLNEITGLVFTNGGGGAFDEVVNSVDNITLVYDKVAFIAENLDKELTVSADLPGGSTVISGTAVKLFPNDNDAVIYYTLDGTDPTRDSKVYNGKVILTADETSEVTLKVLVTLEGNGDSDIFTYTYTVTNGNKVLADFENPANYSVSGGTTAFANGQLTFSNLSGWPVSVGVTPVAFDAQANSGIAFHVTVPNTLEDNHLILCLKEAGGACYQFASNKPVYTVTDGGVAATLTTNADTSNWYTRRIVLAGGFSGWIIIPATAMEACDSTWGSGADANGQLDLGEITLLGFSHANGAQNDVTLSVDDVILAENAAAFAGECEAKALSIEASHTNGDAVLSGNAVTYEVESGATIYYTTDGTAPTRESSVYADGIRLTNTSSAVTSATVKLLVVKDGRKDMTYSFTYSVVPPSTNIADFSNPSEYTVTVPAGEGTVADGKLSFYTASGWPATFSTKPAQGYLTGDNSAVAFRLSVPADKAGDNELVFCVLESGGAGYLPGANKPYYLIADGTTEAVQRTASGNDAAWYTMCLFVPGGFSGWVVVPTSSLVNTGSTWSGITDKNGQLDLDQITQIGFGHGTGSQNAITYTVDDVTVAYDTDAFIADNLPKIIAVTPSVESGSVVISGTELTLSANEANAVIRYTTDGSDPVNGKEYEDGIVLKNTSSAPITVTVKVLATMADADDTENTYTYTVLPVGMVVADFEQAEDYNVSAAGGEATVANGVLTYKASMSWPVNVPLTPADGYVTGDNSAIALHMSVPSEYYFTIGVKEAGGATYLFSEKGLPIYLLSDDGTMTESATFVSDGGVWYNRCTVLPGGFSGWVIIPTASLVNVASTWGSVTDANGKLDLDQIVQIGFTNAASSNNSVYLTVDDVTVAYDLDAFAESKKAVKNDLNGDKVVNSRDAIYLLYHTLLPEQYPIADAAACDFNGDGTVDSNDAIYLLYHCMLPDIYPID